jgi:hypothetical protein
MINWFWRISRRLTGARHPGVELLVAWQQNTAGVALPEWVGTHLRGCASCCRRTERIRLALERSSRALDGEEAAATVEDGVERLLSVLRDEAVVGAVNERLQRGRDVRLAAGLAVYFGAYPMSLLERSVAGGPPFRVEVERLVEAFLGRRAASALISRSETEFGAVGEGA